MFFCIYVYIDDRPATSDQRRTSDFEKLSATDHPIHFMFGTRGGFSGTAHLMALFPVRTNPRWRPPPSWKNFKWPYLRTGRQIQFMFGPSMGFLGTADLMALSPV